METYERERRLYERQLHELRHSKLEEPPLLPDMPDCDRFLADDVTVEAVTMMHAAQPRGLLLPAEWDWLRASILADAQPRYGMPAVERVTLYTLAIQTGLRSNELRSLTRGRLYLDGSQPYVTCKADSTKDGRESRQYIPRETALELRALVASKMPGAAVFAMPDNGDV